MLVPPEFIDVYRWFSDPRNSNLKQLPFGKGTPKGFAFPLARQAGIFSPSYNNLPSCGAEKKDYVLLIHSEGQRYYDDKTLYIEKMEHGFLIIVPILIIPSV